MPQLPVYLLLPVVSSTRHPEQLQPFWADNIIWLEEVIAQPQDSGPLSGKAMMERLSGPMIRPKTLSQQVKISF